MYEYYFTITDCHGTYDWTGRFKDHFEAADFIAENEAEGGQVICKAPFYKFIPDAKPFEI